MIRFVEFWGLTDRGRRYYGRVILEGGRFRVQGGRLVKSLLNWRIRDPRGGHDQSWRTRKDGLLFLRTLPLYICGSRLCGSRVKVVKK